MPRYRLKKFFLFYLTTIGEEFGCETIAKATRATRRRTIKLLAEAFTLAEVLIVLGIIGLVADMTIPTLVNSIGTKEKEVRLQKFYSTMHQAIKLSEIDNGPAADWDLGEYNNKDSTAIFFKKYLAPYFRVQKICEGTNCEGIYQIENWLTVILSDGSFINFWKGSCLDIQYDTNGVKKPNSKGYDLFRFLLCSGHFTTYWASKTNTREQLLQNCKTNSTSCSALLEYDGWVFKDDYPYK